MGSQLNSAHTDIPEAETDGWTDEGCRAVSSSAYHTTQCRCDHVGFHGVSYSPVLSILERIDVSLLLGEQRNVIIYAVYGAALAVYFILLILGYYGDRHDYNTPGWIFQKDNQLTDKQLYEVSIKTGCVCGAGTTARVSLVIRGERGHSETKDLTCDERAVFGKSARDKFIVSLPESLGNITSLLIWHDNGGTSPAWYLSRVWVHDLVTGRRWLFISDRWLAVEEADGKIERELKPVTTGLGFRKAFLTIGAQFFSDYFIWSSVLSRPPYSVFTRVQRVTCCSTVTMAIMGLNTLWYKAICEKAIHPSGSTISGEAILCGLVAAVATLPVSVPIIMLFRRAKPPQLPAEFKKLCGLPGKTPSEEEKDPTLSHQFPCEAQRDAQLLNQTADNFRELQDWALKKWNAKPENERVQEWGDGCMLGDEITDETSFSSGFGDNSSSSKGSSSWNSNMEKLSGQGSGRSLTSQREVNMWLPHTYYYIAWACCIGIILTSSALTLLVGRGFSSLKASYWIQACYVSSLICFFITQPLLIVILTAAKAWRQRNNPRPFDPIGEDEETLDPAELKKRRLDNYDMQIQKGIESKQRARFLRYARPRWPEELERGKRRAIKEKNITALVWDVALFTVTAFCLTSIFLSMSSSLHYPVKKGITDRFLRNPQPFTNVTTPDQLWQWIEGPLFNELYPEGTASCGPWGETSMNCESFVISHVILRQLRNDERQVKVPEFMSHHMWVHHMRVPQQNDPLSSGEEPWRSRTGKEAGKRKREIPKFDGFEYSIILNGTRDSATQQIISLQRQGWVDHLTGAVVIEFIIYNAPANIFSAVSLSAEMPGTGAIHPQLEVQSVSAQTRSNYFILFCELLFLLLTAISGKQEVQRALKLKSKYLTDVWSWIEICSVVLAVVYFVVSLHRNYIAVTVTRKLRATYNDVPVDVSSLAYWEQCMRVVIGLLVFITLLKFLRLLRFSRVAARLGAVIDEIMTELLVFLVTYVVVELIFACLGYQLFGTHYYPMSHLYLATGTVTTLIFGGTTPYDGPTTTLWALYHMAHAIVLAIIFSGLVKAASCHSYRRVKATHNAEPITVFEIMVLCWHRLAEKLGIKKLREEVEPPKFPLEFTLSELENQVEELYFRMDSICSTYGLPKRLKKYSGSEESRDDGISTCSAEGELTYDEEHLGEQFFPDPDMEEYLDLKRDSADEEEMEFREQLILRTFQQLQMNRTSASESDMTSGPSCVEETKPGGIHTKQDQLGNTQEIVESEPLLNIGSLIQRTIEAWPGFDDSSSQHSSSVEPYSSDPSSRSCLTSDPPDTSSSSKSLFTPEKESRPSYHEVEPAPRISGNLKGTGRDLEDLAGRRDVSSGSESLLPQNRIGERVKAARRKQGRPKNITRSQKVVKQNENTSSPLGSVPLSDVAGSDRRGSSYLKLVVPDHRGDVDSEDTPTTSSRVFMIPDVMVEGVPSSERTTGGPGDIVRDHEEGAANENEPPSLDDFSLPNMIG